MSLWAEYLKEKTGAEMVETPFAFASYRFQDEKTVFIMDLYVVPERRRRKVASDIADKVVEAAKAKGCSRLLASVIPSAPGSTEALALFLDYGMRLDSSATDFVLFSKEI